MRLHRRDDVGDEREALPLPVARDDADEIILVLLHVGEREGRHGWLHEADAPPYAARRLAQFDDVAGQGTSARVLRHLP